MPLKSTLLVVLLACGISAEATELTDKTWKAMLDGQWMVEFYTPWCPACQQFNATWKDFSRAMVSKKIRVAAIDVDQYPSLSSRFSITSLPTVYYVRDGVFRVFSGQRSLKDLKDYIERQDWKQTEPVSWLYAPDSILMSVLSSVLDVSTTVKNAYILLRDDYAWPPWIIYVAFGVVAVLFGVLIGFGVLTIIDYCVGGLGNRPRAVHAEESDEADSDDQETVDKQEPVGQTVHQRRVKH